MNLRYIMVLSPTLHRVCTDFGTEEERRYIGTTSDQEKQKSIEKTIHNSKSVESIDKEKGQV